MIPHLSLIRTINSSNFFSESTVRQFTIEADEPIANNGTNLAPSPLDLLNASLASCTSSFLRFHANKKEISIGKIEVKIKVRFDEENMLVFERSITFENTISDEDEQYLLEKTQHTPMTKIIMNTQKITTTILR
ncbi:OsmC family protein [Chryseobacterium aquifrigidense]|uniref:Putative redox protein n=1 Tax=Chryseobacterium aquifrigidense TaxID=558021 RepID=A0A543EHK9_9FLAO|nr:OsmC family protein [Chryseobacterium aquifrigidense]TQM21080.1 putative redox protein [Chryseobacterium aquifrigidense]